MTTNTSMVELVKFEAAGLDNIQAAVKRLSEASQQATERQAAFAKAMNDPAFRRATSTLDAARKSTASMVAAESARLDLMRRGSNLATGAYAKELRSIQAIAREQERVSHLERAAQIRNRFAHVTGGGFAANLQARAANDTAERRAQRLEERQRIAQQRAYIGTPAHTREVKDTAQLMREQSQLAAASRRAELIALHGRTAGGVMAFAEGRGGQAVQYGAGAALGMGGGMVRQGFSGTVEENRLALEMKLASRELAGAFLPAIKAVTAAVRFFREKLEKLGPTGQNAVMAGGLGLASHFALRAASGKGLMGWGSQLLGSGGGAVAGQIAAGVATNAAINSATRLHGLGTPQPPTPTPSVPQQAAAGGIGAAALKYGKYALKYGGPLAAAYATVDGLSGGYVSMLRARGNDWGTSILGGLGGGLADTLTFGEFSDYHKKKGNIKSDSSRRQVTVADAGFDEIGSAYYRLSEKLALTDPSTDPSTESTAKLDQIMKSVDKIIDEFQKHNNSAGRTPLERG